MSDIHLDQNVLASLLDVMGEEYPVLLDTFLVDSDERQRHIHEALAAADPQALRLAAHSFKGSCSNMGAPMLAGLCKQLEEAARRELLDGRRRWSSRLAANSPSCVSCSRPSASVIAESAPAPWQSWPAACSSPGTIQS